MEIIKSNGELHPLDLEKLNTSLKNAGATEHLSQKITDEVTLILYDGISSKEIYKTAFTLLKKYSRPTAARYKLKKAIMEMGETGYPFEKFVAELLKNEGFNTNVGVIVQGHCVKHEVDVIAEKDNLHYMCECKFHNTSNRNCNVKIPLYIQSRFKDVEQEWKKKEGHSTKFHQGWIFTNTRFTKDAIQYGACSGLQLISWDYPKNKSIKERVDRLGIHPITCLTTLTMKEKKAILKIGKVLCMDLCMDPTLLTLIGVKETQHKNILKEAHEVCFKPTAP